MSAFEQVLTWPCRIKAIAGRQVKFVNQGDAKAEISVVSTSEQFSKYRIETERFRLEIEEKQRFDICRVIVLVQDT